MITWTLSQIQKSLAKFNSKKSSSIISEREITEDTKLFFVGTTESKFDLASQNFTNYKQLDKITVENAAFGTSTWGYALSYAKQYATENDHGVIVSFQLKPGLKVFDLRDPAEYASLGIPKEIAMIFKDAEPYFAINTEVPAQQSSVRPPEFMASLSWLKFAVGANAKYNSTILDLLVQLDEKAIPSTIEEVKIVWKQAYVQFLEQAFKQFFGVRKWIKLRGRLTSERFNSINELIELGVRDIYTPEMHALKIKVEKLKQQFFQDRNLKRTKIIKGSQLEKELFDYLKANGIPFKPDKKIKGREIPAIAPIGAYGTYPTNAFKTCRAIPLEDLPADQWTYRFKAMSEPNVVPNLDNFPEDVQILAHNCSLLYKNPKSGSKPNAGKNQKANIDDDRTAEKILGYMKLFQICKQHILNAQDPKNADSIQVKKFSRGIETIKRRLKSDSKHIYIDYLQFVFFSLLVQNDQYIGVTCPELRGYAHIHRWSGKKARQMLFPYGYEAEIKASTIYDKDMTVILCKPLQNAVESMFGHLVDFIDTKEYRKKLKLDPNSKSQITSEEFREVLLPDIQNCKSVDDYKKIYFKDIDPLLNSTDRNL